MATKRPGTSRGECRVKVPRMEDSSMCGVIQNIVLTNFMCHGSFEWSPNTNVNFVTGVNGSGKSSILQGTQYIIIILSFSWISGLVLGLLADSKHTKRYSKLQDFIRRGANKAEIKVNQSVIREILTRLLKTVDSNSLCIPYLRLLWRMREMMPLNQKSMAKVSLSKEP